MSTFVHLVAFVALALLTIPDDVAPVERIVVVSPRGDAPDEQLEQLELQTPPLEIHKISAAALPSPDIGMANLGSALKLSTTFSPIFLGDISPALGEFGNLFGKGGRGMADAGTGVGGAEFFGIKAGGQKFVFIVDSSRSMASGKFEAAKQELAYAVRRLKPDQYFYVIFFDRNAERMRFEPNDGPEPRFVPATRGGKGNINKLERWMATIELEVGTDPSEAVEFAMSLRPDAIYILTDGKFLDGGRTERYLEVENWIDEPAFGSRPKVAINTVGFYRRDGEETLQRIARQYGGTYQFVPPPLLRK